MKSTPLHIRKLAFFSASVLVMATIELLIPKPLPFFKIGLANAILLLSLSILQTKEFILLSLIKVLLTSFLSGTLFSPIFLISFSSSITSSLIMLILYLNLYKRNLISFIGISTISALAYNITLLFTSSYLLFTVSIWYLAVPLLSIGTVSSFLIGLVLNKSIKDSEFLKIAKTKDPVSYEISGNNEINKYPLLLLLLLPVIYIGNYKILLALAIILTISTIVLKVKIKLKTTIITTLAIVISQLLIKRGLVIYENRLITITKDALENGIYLSLYLYCLIRIGSLVSRAKVNVKNKKIKEFLFYFNAYRLNLKFKLGKHDKLSKQLDKLLKNAYNSPINIDNNIKNIRGKNKYIYVLVLLSTFITLLIFYKYNLI